MHSFGQKMGWAAFWAIVSQAHLATLSCNDVPLLAQNKGPLLSCFITTTYVDM
jgi:hypothetical protein